LVREGKIVGGAPYGYRSTAEKGKPEINPETVEIVRRIFREYLAGASPREIAAQLNREGIKAPRGEAWIYSYIQLMLANALYAGEYIWNRSNNVRNPKTGKINHRASDAAVTIALPHLRIIDQQTWEAVQAKRQQRAYRQFGEMGKVTRRVTPRPFIGRNAHPIADLLRCGVCGSHMLIRSVTKGIPWVACAAAVGHGTCSHKRTYNLDTMQLGFRKATAKYLGDPRAIVEATKAYYAEWTQGRKQHRDDAASLRKQLDRVQLKISRIVVAIRDSDTPVHDLLADMKPLQIEKAGLSERLRIAEAESTVVELRPKAIEAFEQSIHTLREIMTSDAPLGPDVKHALAAFFDCLVVHETARRADYVVEPIVRIGALMGGVDILGIKNMSRGDTGSSYSPLAQQPSTSVLPIGRWQLVA
jgi:site-specific DNA recombinase